MTTKLTKENIKKAMQIYFEVGHPDHYINKAIKIGDQDFIDEELEIIMEGLEERRTIEDRLGYTDGSYHEKFWISKTSEDYSRNLHEKGIEYVLGTDPNLSGDESSEERERLLAIQGAIYDSWEQQDFPTHRKDFES